jgi:SAM-dependent methyltransferase
MRKSIRHFVRICVDNLPLKGPLYEFGALQVSGAPEENLRGLFAGFEYIGADMREGPGVDLQLDLHSIALPDAVASCVLCMDTLEHVEYPRKAMDEIWRILRPDGIAIISSVFDFPIHDYPNDYWRFTPEGFRSLLQKFDRSFVGSYGLSEVSPQSIVGVGFKGGQPKMEGFLGDYQNWRTWNNALMKEAVKAH